MSHKTGKRVLATTATSALAFAGLIAMPLASHAAAADVTLTNVCGGDTAGDATNGLDYVTFPNDGTTYEVNGLSVDTSTADPAGTAPDSEGIVKSADGTKVYYYLPDSAYELVGGSATYGKLKPTFEIYDSTGARVADSVVAAANINVTKCAVASVPVPTAKNKAGGLDGGSVTVPRGEGLVWTIDDGAGNAVNTKVTNAASVLEADDKTIKFSGASAVLEISDDTAVTVTAKAAPGYTYTGPTGVLKNSFKLDGAVQVNYVAPVVVDRDGKDSDTFTVTNNKGLVYYYTGNAALKTTPTLPDPDDNVSSDANDVMDDWIELPQDSGATTSVTRPAKLTGGGTVDGPTTGLMVIAVPADGYKLNAAGDKTHDKTTLTWLDNKSITAIPAPEMVNGDGADDYYVLPKVEGVEWTVTSSVGSAATYASNNPLVGTRIPVYTYGQTTPVTYTFKATAEAAAPGLYKIDTTKVTKTEWTQDFDSRAQIAPVGPSFHDVTGLMEDSITFPALATGLQGYRIGLGVDKAAAKANSANNQNQFVDGTWYGKTVKLTDLQRAYANNALTSDSVYIEAVLNNQLYTLAKDAEGNDVRKDWSYEFSAGLMVIPEPPVVNDQPGTSQDTLTFPVDPRVIYKAIQNGVTKEISYADRGKPLPYTGQVTVRAEAATGYLLQPGPDGNPPAPWVITFDSSLGKVTPENPQSHDRADTDQDTYVVPNQPGVLWNVDGVDLDPSQYGKEIATGGKLEMRFVARAAQGYSLADGAENEFFLHWTDTPSTGGIGDPEISHTIRDNGYQADVEWSGPEDAEGVTYTVEFAKVTQDDDGDEVLGTLQTWKEDTEETGGRFSAGYGVTYKIYVTATDEHGTESETVSEYISFSEDPRGTESRWVDINRSTVTPSGNDALGWYQAGSSLYFNNTAFVTYRDQSNITFTVNGGQQLRVYGTQYTKGGRALIQVNGTNWAWLDAGASSNADPYKKMLRQINLPNTGTHTIKIIASLLPGKELALDAYEVVK